MNKFTNAIKSVVTGAAFAAVAMVSTSANAEIIVGEQVMKFASEAVANAFCANSVINCTSTIYDHHQSLYVVTYT